LKNMLLLISLAGLLCGCAGPATKYERAGVAMGTTVGLTIYAPAGEAEELADQVQDLLDETEQELSWRLQDSQISRINASAGKQEGYDLSGELAEHLHLLWQVSEDSDGAFDLTIAPVVRLWDIDRWALEDAEHLTGEIVPDKAQVAQKLTLTGYERVRFDEGSEDETQGAGERIYLPEGYMLDLGAAGKGLACDRVLALLEGRLQGQTGDPAARGAILSLGGNILTYGSKPDGSAWKVGITDPENPGDYLGVLTLTGTNFVTTSGDYERYVEVDGARYHHIIDPATGYPADSGVRSVTILSDRGMLGDALSTACFVLGAEKGMQLAAKYDVEILMVTDDGELVMSEGMKKVFTR